MDCHQFNSSIFTFCILCKTYKFMLCMGSSMQNHHKIDQWLSKWGHGVVRWGKKVLHTLHQLCLQQQTCQKSIWRFREWTLGRCLTSSADKEVSWIKTSKRVVVSTRVDLRARLTCKQIFCNSIVLLNLLYIHRHRSNQPCNWVVLHVWLQSTTWSLKTN